MGFFSKLFGEKEESVKQPETREPGEEVEGITFVGRETVTVQNNPFGPPNFTYMNYKAENAETAKAFLETQEVKEEQFFILVETPEGKWGRKKDGIYKVEKDDGS